MALVLVGRENSVFAQAIFSFSELAHHPTSLWISLLQESLLRKPIELERRFSLAVLASDQREVARAHWETGSTAKIQLIPRDGFWVVPGALACSFCEVRKSISIGGNVLFLASILGGVVESRKTHRRHLLVSDL